jgi:pimeloyl-ACP methyl ester carboxylesterase
MNNDQAVRTPTGAVVRYLDRSEGRVAFDVQGPEGAPLVVCLPGMGDLRQVFRFNVRSLLEAGLRVATMDLRGQGDSDTTFSRF